MRQPGTSRRQLGADGEQRAFDYLQHAGYTILERNWRCRTGELDLIAEYEGILIFLEVRSRRQIGAFGSPEESVDRRKQRRVRDTAQYYLHKKQRHESGPVRFDVVAVYYNGDGQFQELKHYPNVF